MGHVRHLLPLGDSADKRHIGLHEVNRIRAQIVQELVFAVQALAENNWCADLALQRSIALHVVIQNWLLDPAETQPIKLCGLNQRLGSSPFLVEIHQ